MQKIVQGTVTTVTGVFKAADGSNTQPVSATAKVKYKNLSNVDTTDTINLSYNSGSGVWSGTWDSTNCIGGYVHWKVQGTSPLQVAGIGTFEVVTNGV